MLVEKQIAESMKQRVDLIRIVDDAAEFLAERDTDRDSQARAVWRLWPGPNEMPLIGLGLKDQDYERSQQFSPSQLEPIDIRELRMLNLWNEVLRARARRAVAHVNELLAQYQGEGD